MREENEANRLVFDVVDASLLKAAFCAAGWKARHIRSLTRGDYLSKLRPVVEGYAEVRPREFLIDFAVQPPQFIGGQVELKLDKHVGTGTMVLTRIGDCLYLDGHKINLLVCRAQRKGCLSGDIEKAVRGMLVLNASLAHFLVKNPFLVPRSWYRFTRILFWDTQYMSDRSRRFVTTLEMPDITEMHVGYEHISYGSGVEINGYSPSAVLKP